VLPSLFSSYKALPPLHRAWSFAQPVYRHQGLLRGRAPSRPVPFCPPFSDFAAVDTLIANAMGGLMTRGFV